MFVDIISRFPGYCIFCMRVCGRTFHIRKFPLVFTVLVSVVLSNLADAMTLDETRHLLTRSGFSPSPHEISAYLPLTKAQAVRAIIDSLEVEALTESPQLISEQFYTVNPTEEPVKDACQPLTTAQVNATPHDIYSRRYAEHFTIKKWWWQEIIATQSPMTERLVMMWHDHFATAFDLKAVPQFHYLSTIRAHGSGDFRQLAVAMLKDPAMIYYLDNYKNQYKSPNENLAREFLELFTMGEGNYSENDVKDLAKVLAGHGLDIDGCSYYYDERYAYPGETTLFGVTAKRTLEDAVNDILKQDAVAEFIVTKIWQEFVAPQIQPQELEPLARLFRNSDYNIKVLLAATLNHPRFWDADNRGSLVKSPVELLAGMVRSFQLNVADLSVVMSDAALIGHDLLVPPDVSGWSENEGWLDPKTVMLRVAAIDRLWNAHQNMAQVRDDYPDLDGLLMLVGSKHKPGQSPRVLDIVVNGAGVAHVTLEQGDAYRIKDAIGVLQLPELVFVPASQLPPIIDDVTVKYRPSSNTKSDMGEQSIMIHWLQYQGVRYTPNVAHQVGANEKAAAMTTPNGYLFHDVDLVFDLGAIHQRFQVTDKKFMAYNVVTPLIGELLTFGQEQGSFNEHPLEQMGAFNKTATLFSKLSERNSEGQNRGVPHLALLPAYSQQEIQGLSPQEQLKSLTFSPLYQLK